MSLRAATIRRSRNRRGFRFSTNPVARRLARCPSRQIQEASVVRLHRVRRVRPVAPHTMRSGAALTHAPPTLFTSACRRADDACRRHRQLPTSCPVPRRRTSERGDDACGCGALDRHERVEGIHRSPFATSGRRTCYPHVESSGSTRFASGSIPRRYRASCRWWRAEPDAVESALAERPSSAVMAGEMMRLSRYLGLRQRVEGDSLSATDAGKGPASR